MDWLKAHLAGVKTTEKKIQLVLASLTTAKGLGDLIESSFKATFPKSYFSHRFNTGLGSSSLYLDFMLCGSIDDCPNRINLNDPMFHRLAITGFDKAGNVVGPLTLSKAMGGTLNLVATPGTGAGAGAAMNLLKLGFAGRTGSPEKIAEYLSSYFVKAKATVLKNLDSLYGTDEFKSYIRQQVSASVRAMAGTKMGTQLGDPKGPPPETSQEMLSRVKDMIDAAKKAGLNINTIWVAVPDKVKVEYKHTNWTYQIAANLATSAKS